MLHTLVKMVRYATMLSTDTLVNVLQAGKELSAPVSRKLSDLAKKSWILISF